MQWLYDHKIDGTALFPAAAHLVTILEAAQDIADADRAINSFILPDVAFHNPLIIPNNSDIEIAVQMCTQYGTTRAHSPTSWTTFSISACTNGKELET